MARSFNNPGNIRAGQNYAGETGENYKASDGSEYVVFDTKEMGLRALFVDLRSKVKEFDGDIDKIINKYAPPSDKNPTKKYAEFVKSAVGKDKVTLQDLPKLVSAVVRFENKPELAKQYLKPDVINTAYQLSEKNMPKQTRLADAKKIIGMPDTATIDQKLPSETILSVVPPKPDAREGRAEALRERVLLSMDNEKKLSEYGWSGVGLRIVASILDPAAIGASVLTEGYLAPMIWGSKATRLARAVRGAAGGAVTNSAIEAYLVSQNAVKDPYDILYGFAGGLILGGSIGAAFGKNNDELFRDALVKIDKDTKAAQTADVSQAMQERFGGGGLAGDQTALPSIAFSSTDTGVGAAINPMSAPIQIPDLRVDLEDMIEEVGDPPQASWGKLRFDMTGALKSSPFSLVRKMGNILGEDSVGFNRGGEVMESTADLLKTNGMKATLAKYYQVYDTSYKDWAKSNGIGYFRSTWGSSRSQFGELVADAIENPNGVHDPNVVRAAQRQAELFRDTLRKAKDAGVKGFITLSLADHLHW
jgi:hypothetical protein